MGLIGIPPVGAQTAPTYDPYLDVYILTAGAARAGDPVVVRTPPPPSITRTGDNNHGLEGTSETGGYPPEMLAALQNFSAAPFQYRTTRVLNPDGTFAEPGNPVAGVRIRIDEDETRASYDLPVPIPGAGGQFTINELGEFDFNPGSDFVDLLAGQSVQTSIEYDVLGTNTLNSETRSSRGRLVVTVSRAQGGTLSVNVEGAEFRDFGASGLPLLPEAERTVFPDLKGYVTSMLQYRYSGAAGSDVRIENGATITTNGVMAHGIYAHTEGLNGVNGRDAGLFRSSRQGGAGGQGGGITVVTTGDITTLGNESVGILAKSTGGDGGSGGEAYGWNGPSSGGAGADGSEVRVSGSGTIRTSGDRSSGILAMSQGGDGGAGGNGATFYGPTNGAKGGAGGTVVVNGSWTITTGQLGTLQGIEAHGIFAKSLGGVAGSGGKGGWTNHAGDGGEGTSGGSVTVTSAGRILTYGPSAHGIYGLSSGGFGGQGGEPRSIFREIAGGGGAAGSGGSVNITNASTGWIETFGRASHGIFAQSVGGGGGSGGYSSWAFDLLGGEGGTGGHGGSVAVTNRGSILTHGVGSLGMYAQSLGGGGGDAGDASTGFKAVGGSGSGTSHGGSVGVTNTGTIVSTSYAIFAESVGGGGGKGGSSSGWFSFGGSGAGGGDGGDVTVSSHGNLTTSELNADAIFAQSLGGGGGAGGNSVAVGAFAAVSIGGSGSAGGKGSIARVGVDPTSSLTNPIIDPVTGTLTTRGENADGIQVQSLGGGGGDGGFSVSVALGTAGAAAFSLGGSGAGGGQADSASAYFGDSLSSITTKGYKANGIFAQSVGGGGGAGGFSIAGATSQMGFTASIALGGSGGGGGNGGGVTVGDALHPILGTITTEGGSSSTTPGARGLAHGIFAQSVGGGGGSGGMSIAGGLAPVALNFAMGGTGAGGGSGSTVDVTTGATITTKGANSHGVFAQSVGGGGGAGGFGLTVGVAAVNVGVSLGGNGGAGGAGSDVTAANSGLITTMGPLSHGMFAQSVGGGGGAGGFAIAGSLTMSGALDFGLGGKGSTGGNAGVVTVTNTGTIATGFVGTAQAPIDDPNDPFLHSAKGSKGIVAQSIGGGGGAGGFGGAFSLQFNPLPQYPSGSIAIGIGGSGGGAGNGSAVTVTNAGWVSTKAGDSAGIFAQSVGGGGGDAGSGLSAAISGSAGKNVSAGVAVGGHGGSGGSGAAVTVTNTNTISTGGDNSQGIFAQSVGGGGGNGGAAVSLVGSLGTTGSYSGSVAVGGDGAGGGVGEHVTVTNQGVIETTGNGSTGILAQSIGGGGGNGGMSVSLSAAGPPARSLSLSVGGDGGEGGYGGQVDILGGVGGSITTRGHDAPGIDAQSIGGGGGNGGLSAAVNLSLADAKKTSVALTGSIGGDGGHGNLGGAVNVGTATQALRGSITTIGDDSSGIRAQSIGGGGGNGGLSFAGSLQLMQSKDDVKNFAASVSVGGSGGSGNNGGAVGVYHAGTIDTTGDGSHGIEAQSVGKGGGNGGSARSVTLQLGRPKIPLTGSAKNLAFTVSLGGDGGGAGSGGTVTVDHTGDIFTRGGDAYGIYAYSVGGGGGSGGNGHLGFPGSELTMLTGADYTTFYLSPNFVLGGSGGASGNGGDVSVRNVGTIATTAGGSTGIFAQSVGGGGGAGGNGVLGLSLRLFSGALGGGVGTTGNGGRITVQAAGTISTQGDGAEGIFAESVGGGGGKAGGVERGFNKMLYGLWNPNWNIGWGPAFGRDAGNAGNGGAVTVDSTADIFTSGSGSVGIFAHSIGGGGGILGTIGRDSPYWLNFAGSTGGFGKGGDVIVNQTGSIVTTGEGADGIFAQSAGGARCDDPQLPCWNLLATHPEYIGLGGAVSVTLNGGHILTLGPRSDGIFAQSIGQADSSDITVSILDPASIIIGGSQGGAAIRVVDGKENTITSYGTLTTMDGVTGTAIVATGKNDRVTNWGTVIGSVDLGQGTNAFNNEDGAWFMPGSTVNVGPSGSFTNAGTLSLGGMGYLQATSITGAFTQAGAPKWLVDIGASGHSDTLVASGTTQLGGTTTIDINGVIPLNEQGRYTLLTGPGGLLGAKFQFGTMHSAMPIGLTFGLVNSDTKQELTLMPSTGKFYWAGRIGGAWAAPFVNGEASWRTGGGDYIYGTPGVLSDVVFSRGGQSSMGADFIVNSLTFSGEPHTLLDSHTLTIQAEGGNGLFNDGSATLGVRLALGSDQAWWNDGVLLVNGSEISGFGQRLTVGGAGTTIISSPIATRWGSLTKTGSGLLMLGGVNTYSGGTTVLGGTLLGNATSLQGNIRNEATLIFDQQGAGLYAGSLSGNGAVIKQGDGALYLTGNSWPFAGSTTVSSGQLFVYGLLGGSSVTMKQGTLLGGIGTVTTTTIERGAVLAPGHSVGVLQILGDLHLNPGATLRLETEAYGYSDAALVSGQVFADGATLDIQAIGSKRYRPINFYRMFETGGGFTGSFSNISTNLAYLNPSVQYSGSTVNLTLRRSDVDFRSVGTRGNQTSVALALNQLVATATGGLASVVNNIYDLTDGDALNAMGSMTGVLYQFGARLGLDASRAFTSAAMRRLATVTRGEERALPNTGFGVSGGMGQSAGTSEERYGGWFSGFGGSTRYFGSAVDASAKAPSPGFIGGVDAAVSRTITLGISGGRAWPELTMDGRADKSKAKLTHAGLYGRYASGATRIDGAFGWSWLDQEAFRTITDGVGTVASESNNAGDGLMFHVEYGRSFDVGRGFDVEPGVGLQIGQLHLDGFTEQGGDVLALAVPARTARSQRLLTGGRVSKALGASSTMMVEGRAAWAHEFEKLAELQLRFSADPFANTFAIAPANDQRDSAVLGFSFAAEPGGKVRVFADLGGEIGGPSRIWSGMLGLTWVW